jgi:pimeloyl-ACP methyl ester carboxylesterase
MSEQVVLVPGLWMNRITMWPLGWRMRDCGFQPAVFTYRTVRDELREQARQLVQFIKRLDSERLHLVGHSLGGRVILESLRQHTDSRIRRAVLLGSPIKGSVAGRAFGRTSLGRRMIGQTAPLWEAQAIPQVPEGVEVGIIAGELPVGLGRLFADIPAPHDGVVSLEETNLAGCKDAICLRINHLGMIYSLPVARQICAFLHHGRFETH